MKKIFTLLIVCLLGLHMYAKEIVVLQGLNTIRTAMETAVDGDVLLLERGGYYPYNIVVNVSGKTFTVDATGDESLAKPKIFPIPNDEGNYPGSWEIDTNFTIKNIHYDGEKDDGSTTVALRTGRDGIKIYIDNCFFTKAGIINCFSALDRLEVTNCISYEPLSNYTGGGGVDLRKSAHKYVIVQNCTFSWNEGDGLPMHWMTGALNPEVMDTLIVDHNTIECNFRGAMSARMVKYFQFTNNLFINSRWVGDPLEVFPPNNESNMPYWDCAVRPEIKDQCYVEECGPAGFVCVELTGSTHPDIDQKVVVRNNNFFWDDEIEAIWDKYDRMQKPTIFSNDFFVVESDTGSGMFFEEKLQMNNKHAAPVVSLENFAKYVESPASEGQTFWTLMGLRGDETASIPCPELAPGVSDIPFEEFDLRYNTDSKSYTADDDGGPIGDPNWWKGTYGTSAIKETSVQASLTQVKTMPNPFNDITTIKYELSSSEQVECVVYSLTGQRVAILVNEYQHAGTRSVKFNASNLASGIYVYKIKAGDTIQTRKLVKE